MSSMRKLAKKGYLTFTQEGSAYVYSAAKPPHEVKFSLLSGILNKVFKGSPVELVESLVKHEAISEADMDDIRRLIDKTLTKPDMHTNFSTELNWIPLKNFNFLKRQNLLTPQTKKVHFFLLSLDFALHYLLLHLHALH